MGIGLAWGWLLTPLLATRLRGWLWAVTAAGLQALAVVWLAQPRDVAAYGLGLVVGGLVHAIWRARLRQGVPRMADETDRQGGER